MSQSNIGKKAAAAAILGPLILLALRIVKSVTGFIVSAVGAGFLVGLTSYLLIKARGKQASNAHS